ncbi:hypothetical protein CB1_000832013 [Camelus ferus]|nr:hypothetical protein CB1_000832013 [Camelus ferus]
MGSGRTAVCRVMGKLFQVAVDQGWQSVLVLVLVSSSASRAPTQRAVSEREAAPLVQTRAPSNRKQRGTFSKLLRVARANRDSKLRWSLVRVLAHPETFSSLKWKSSYRSSFGTGWTSSPTAEPDHNVMILLHGGWTGGGEVIATGGGQQIPEHTGIYAFFVKNVTVLLSMVKFQ